MHRRGGTARPGDWTCALRSRLTYAAAMLALAFLSVEGGLRFLLFHPSALALRWGEDLRNASLFADPFVEDVYWRLRWKKAKLVMAFWRSYNGSRLQRLRHSLR